MIACFNELYTQQYGFKASASYSTMNFQAAGTPGNIKSSWKPGFYLGGLLRVLLNTTLSLHPEYVYRMMKGDDIIFNTDFILHYLSFPVLFRAKLNERIALLAGPEFGLLIHAQQRSSSASLDATHDTEERAVSAVEGVEVRILSSLVAEARYVMGLIT